MAKVDFIRVETNQDLENVDIKDGQFIVSGEGKSFIDYGARRVPTNGTPDTEMSDSSTNSVENKVVKEYIDNKITNEYSESTGKGYSANYINELVSNIQSGIVNFGTVNGNTTTAQTITLSKPYSNTNYKVFCNFQNSGYYWELYSNFIITNKTTTGFEIQWKNNGSGNTNNNIYVSWLTIN